MATTLAYPPITTILSTHTLAASTIARHNTDDAIFDDSELDLLRRFVADPSADNKRIVLASRGWLDEEGDKTGGKAQQSGSLAGYCIARHGTDQPILEPGEITMLHSWFERGQPGVAEST